MLAPSGKPPYIPLQNEQHLFTSSPRVALSITPPSSTQSNYPGNNRQQTSQTSQQDRNFSLTSSSGLLHLTNRRLIFLPDVQPSPATLNQPTPLTSSFLTSPFTSSISTATTAISSFASPILSLHDSHVTAPWFGPNVWTALLQPTAGGGIPIPSTGVVEVKFTFKDGGAFDFHTAYERLRERVQQAAEVARSAGGSAGVGAGAAAAAAGNIHLDQLPAYAERGDGPLLPPVLPLQLPQRRQEQLQRESRGAVVNGDVRSNATDNVAGGLSAKEAEARRDEVCTPDEPPPAYEEAQMAGLQEEMDRRRRTGEDEEQDEDDLPRR